MATLLKLLYLGAAGEHYVMSECFRSNMEAFKLPIDRGFDLAVTSAYKHFKAADDGKVQPVSESPTYLQVKSSSATSQNEESSQRPQWAGKFFIKPSELSLICETSNSALACVSFVESVSDLSLARTTFAWWISSNEVNELRKKNYFIKKDDVTLVLNYKIVERAKDSPYKQNTYVQLMRQSESKNAAIGVLASGTMIDKDCFYFHKLRPQAPQSS